MAIDNWHGNSLIERRFGEDVNFIRKKEMIHILFLIHDLAQGGAEKVLVNLVNHMDKSKFHITVMTLFDVGVNRQFLNSNITYKYCFSHMPRGNSHMMKVFSPEHLYKMLIQDEYDIAVAYLEGPCARIISGCPFEKTKLISWIHIEQHTKKRGAQSFRNYREAKECYSKFNQIVCVSESVKKDFESIFSLENEISVIYNTNDSNDIIEKSKEYVENSIFNDNEFKIIGVGKILKSKGFDRLARIHRRLIENGYLVHTYILGIGPEQKNIESYLKQNNIEDTFTFLGYQTNPYKFVAKCDLFVCASFAEGFSTATTEALIVGTPVITTRVAGMEEMLGTNNEYGIIVDNDEDALFNAIESWIKDKNKQKFYKGKVVERGEFFSTEKSVRATEKFFLKLYEEKASLE